MDTKSLNKDRNNQIDDVLEQNTTDIFDYFHIITVQYNLFCYLI